MPSLSSHSEVSEIKPFLVQPASAAPARRGAIRRRPTREQGRALEMLAHAIEYLADSDLHGGTREYSRDVAHATAILMTRSRAVFAECREVVTIRRAAREALTRMFGRPALMLRPGSTGDFPPGPAGDLHPDSLAR